jgi:hypothetical protein
MLQNMHPAPLGFFEIFFAVVPDMHELILAVLDKRRNR